MTLVRCIIFKKIFHNLAAHNVASFFFLTMSLCPLFNNHNVVLILFYISKVAEMWCGVV